MEKYPTEKKYYAALKQAVVQGAPCMKTGMRSETIHHPRLQALGAGGSQKCFDWFGIILSNKAHDSFHGKDRERTEIELIKKTWKFMGFEPGDFMYEGLRPQKAHSLRQAVFYVLTNEPSPSS